MIAITMLLFLIGGTLFNVVTDRTTIYYRDFRFYLILMSLCIVLWIAVQSVPRPF